MFGSLYFFAVVISSIVFPALSDRIGRRPVCLIGMTLQVTASSFLLIVEQQQVAYFLVFLIGLDFGARVYTGYIFTMEFLT
jgi:Na+/melibiose symporter-like transporter